MLWRIGGVAEDFFAIFPIGLRASPIARFELHAATLDQRLGIARHEIKRAIDVGARLVFAAQRVARAGAKHVESARVGSWLSAR